MFFVVLVMVVVVMVMVVMMLVMRLDKDDTLPIGPVAPQFEALNSGKLLVSVRLGHDGGGDQDDGGGDHEGGGDQDDDGGGAG